MTRVNSPRGSANRSSASLNVPRNTSSNFFVSSRQTATRRAPSASRRAGRLARRRGGVVAGDGEQSAALAGAAGEEAEVGELAARQAGDCEGGGDGGGAGDGGDGEAGGHCRGDEIEARIAGD